MVVHGKSVLFDIVNNVMWPSEYYCTWILKVCIHYAIQYGTEIVE